MADIRTPQPGDVRMIGPDGLPEWSPPIVREAIARIIEEHLRLATGELSELVEELLMSNAEKFGAALSDHQKKMKDLQDEAARLGDLVERRILPGRTEDPGR